MNCLKIGVPTTHLEMTQKQDGLMDEYMNRYVIKQKCSKIQILEAI